MQQAKTDFKKTLDAYRAKRGEFRIVDVPPLQYLMADGHGNPNGSKLYADAIAAMYPLAYRLKFASKQRLGRDYVVMPLEGHWWADDMDAFTVARDKSKWHWTLMMMVPDWITPELFHEVTDAVAAGGRPADPSAVRLETLEEGRCVQTLHVGSYDDEADILDRLHHEYVPGHDLTMRGRHHEIYLSDARKVEPARLRTILRQPVE
jgi:hypothetical protein